MMAERCEGVHRYSPDHDSVDAVVDAAVGGTYVLVFELPSSVTTDVGALGTVTLDGGTYAYVGSARGPGGFGRAERHRRHLDGEETSVHWHIDALTVHPSASFVEALLLPDRDVECAVARAFPAGPVEGFGSSDCGCRSHLSVGNVATFERRVSEVHASTTG